MPWIAPVLGAVGSIASGAMGAASASAGRDAATEAYRQSVADLTAIGIPSIQAQQIVMQQYQSQGKWTPELEQAVQQQQSELAGITTDPNNKAAQMAALSKLQEIGSSGGMTLSDRANLEKVEGNLNSDLRGQRQAILQDAQQRGGYGSGAALSAQLMAQQQSANQAHNSALQTEASARDRALQAIMQSGQLGGQMQSTEFAQKSQQAQAKDAINAWNAQNRQGVANANTTANNQASLYNLQNQQGISNANTDIANQQELYNKQLQQQNFQNQFGVAQAKANARAGQASNLNAQAQGNANAWGNIGSAAAQAGTAIGQSLNDEQNKKKNVPSIPTL